MSYQKLFVWQESYRLVQKVYKLSNQLPDSERFGLVSQMRRAAVSITSNLAEGSGRFGKNEMRHFCSIAIGSANELEVQLMLSKDLGYFSSESYNESIALLRSVLRLLNCLKNSFFESST
jgi:four helix bundle protein